MKLWRSHLDKDTIPQIRGEIQMLPERCKGCQFCVAYCPQGVLAMSDKFNAKGYHLPVVIASEKCVACGLCELICPEFAIFCEEGQEYRE